MLQDILGFYVQGLLLATLLVLGVVCLCFLKKASKGPGRSLQERQEFIFDLLLIAIITIPILAFAMVGIILMIKV